jgi:hypothetical protein
MPSVNSESHGAPVNFDYSWGFFVERLCSNQPSSVVWMLESADNHDAVCTR